MNKLALIFIFAIATLGLNACTNNNTDPGATKSKDPGDYYFGRSKANDNNDPY